MDLVDPSVRVNGSPASGCSEVRDGNVVDDDNDCNSLGSVCLQSAEF